MKEFEAVLLFLGMAALCAALAVRQQRTGKARLGSWGIVDRAVSAPMFLLAQAGWVFMALFCLGCALWVLVRPYL